MNKLKDDVQCDVTRLLVMLNPSCDPETFMFVRDRLTRMSILGTSPPSCSSKGRDRKPKEATSDFSSKKESFIAP